MSYLGMLHIMKDGSSLRPISTTLIPEAIYLYSKKSNHPNLPPTNFDKLAPPYPPSMPALPSLFLQLPC